VSGSDSPPPQNEPSAQPPSPAAAESPLAIRVDMPAETIASSSTLPAEEARHKRQMEAAEAEHKRKKEDEERAHNQKKELDEIRRQSTGQMVAMGLVVVVALGCLVVVVWPGYPAATADKALGILVAIVGGFVGFITGQATKK
jgi:hypothetical protein